MEIITTVEKHPEQDIEALIVEDEIDICFLLTGILRKKNLQSSCVYNIHEARDLLANTHPSILLTVMSSLSIEPSF